RDADAVLEIALADQLRELLAAREQPDETDCQNAVCGRAADDGVRVVEAVAEDRDDQAESKCDNTSGAEQAGKDPPREPASVNRLQLLGQEQSKDVQQEHRRTREEAEEDPSQLLPLRTRWQTAIPSDQCCH